MDPRLLAGLLWQRRQLRAHERWAPPQLAAYQARALQRLRAYAYARSPFYQRFHQGRTDRPLQELPVLTKALLMEHFDDLVTDRAIHLDDVAAHVAGAAGDRCFRGRYRVNATSGTTGRRAFFLFDPAEWATMLASYARAGDWAGLQPGWTHPLPLAVVGSTQPWHQSAAVGASLATRWSPTCRLDATQPLDTIVLCLTAWQPQVLVTYPSSARLLAAAQGTRRLRIAPQAIFTSGEVLTVATRQRIAAAWGQQPFDVYGATESGGLAAECAAHRGLHLYEDLVILESVDAANRPVPPGAVGEKLLLTVLFNRTQPLIRYELSDQVQFAGEPCPCGRSFALLSGVQGRAEEVLYWPDRSGSRRAVSPVVLHRALDAVPAGNWQVVAEPEGLRVLVSGAPATCTDAQIVASLHQALTASGILPPPVEVQRVAVLPRGRSGKAPLIRAGAPPRWAAREPWAVVAGGAPSGLPGAPPA